MRTLLAIGASALAGLAALVARLDGDSDIVPFFVGLTFLGGVAAWAAHPPFEGVRRAVARIASLIWGAAAVLVALGLVMSATMTSGPSPQPEETYVGITATVYHVIGLFVGGALMAASAFAPDRWLDRRQNESERDVLPAAQDAPR